MVGAPYSGSVTLIGADGSFAPRNHGPGVSIWYYDLDAGHLIGADAPPRYYLDDDGLPIVTGVSDIADVQVATNFFASWPGKELTPWFAQGVTVDRAVTFIRIQVSTVTSIPRRLAVYVALRPFGVEPDMHSISSVSCDPATSTLIADGAVVLTGLQPASACGVSTLSQSDIASLAARNRVPDSTALVDPGQRAEGMLRLDVTAMPGSPASLEFRAPLTPQHPAPDVLAGLTRGTFDGERAKVAQVWRSVLNRVNLDVPDPRLNASFRASQMYLFLNRRGDLPRSGPLAHDAFWVRDATYIGEALERMGAGVDNQATLEELLRSQRADGSFPAITDPTGPRTVEEWDEPGEAIVGVVAHYRFTHDIMWLARIYPNLRLAAQFLDALRGRTLKESPESISLLPANLSAEDLGPESWHHYWDDFWAIAGYREAGFAASELGRTDEAAQLSSRAEDLQVALIHSVALVEARTGVDYVPNGPEDVLSSAMARGTTPALWPFRSLQGPAAADLLGRSFRRYQSAWLAAQGGGYQHYQGTLWPYGGLGIAHAMLRLGMRAETQQVLTWTIDHQTLPGTYAWGEAINERNGGLELGDMPHSWASAELVSLVRDMLLTEDDGWLVVNSGAPDTWFEPGKSVSLQNAPTQYGTASILMSCAFGNGADPPSLRVELQGNPPKGWQVRLPGAPSRLHVDGGGELVLTNGELRLGPGSHTLVVSFVPSPVTGDRSACLPTSEASMPPGAHRRDEHDGGVRSAA
jgi:hypothetical protein